MGRPDHIAEKGLRATGSPGRSRSPRRPWAGGPPSPHGDRGSLPNIPSLSRAAGVPALLVGFGLPRSNPHAPNERISLTANDRGVATIMDLLTRVGDRTSQEAELRGT